MFEISNDWISTPQSKQLISGLFGAPEKFDLVPTLPAHGVNCKKLNKSQKSGKLFVKKLKLKRRKLEVPASVVENAHDNEKKVLPTVKKPSNADDSVEIGEKVTCVSEKLLKRKRKREKKQLNSKEKPCLVEDSIVPVSSSLECPEKKEKNSAREKLSEKRKAKKDCYLEKAEKRMKGSRFRMLNERLYTTTGQEAMEFFQEDPQAFKEYHEGYQEQLEEWPENPNQVIADWIKKKPKNWIVADFGCGQAVLAILVPQKVYSFDLVALNDRVTVANMNNVPLLAESTDVVVFCLSLMGTDIVDFLVEARRVLKVGGLLKIAEVGSRFENIKQFIHKMERLGFQCQKKEHGENGYFVMFEFQKTAQTAAKETLPNIRLKPCIYKKR